MQISRKLSLSVTEAHKHQKSPGAEWLLNMVGADFTLRDGVYNAQSFVQYDSSAVKCGTTMHDSRSTRFHTSLPYTYTTKVVQCNPIHASSLHIVHSIYRGAFASDHVNICVWISALVQDQHKRA